MKLPTLVSAETASAHQRQSYNAGLQDRVMQGVQPNGIFDSIIGGIGDIISGGIGKIPCILGKAGPKGVACLTQCGPNPACLATCAGPTLVNSIMECL